jgi:DNA-binding NarL/FixJ family response regulator
VASEGYDVRIIIADDHALVRQGLSGFLEGAFPSWRFEQAATLEEAKVLIQGGKADMLIIDLHMPGMEGASSLASLRMDHPDLKLAVLTATEDRDVILESLGAGVHGYILKIDPTEEVLTAIQTIMDGGIYVPKALSRVLRPSPGAAPSSRDRPPVALPTLTKRQRDVMALLAEGLPTKVIARRLDLGVGTVKVHLAALFRQLNVHTRMEAVVKSGALLEQQLNAASMVKSDE